jgi:hypothetical protein
MKLGTTIGDLFESNPSGVIKGTISQPASVLHTIIPTDTSGVIEGTISWQPTSGWQTLSLTETNVKTLQVYWSTAVDFAKALKQDFWTISKAVFYSFGREVPPVDDEAEYIRFLSDLKWAYDTQRPPAPANTVAWGDEGDKFFSRRSDLMRMIELDRLKVYNHQQQKIINVKDFLQIVRSAGWELPDPLIDYIDSEVSISPIKENQDTKSLDFHAIEFYYNVDRNGKGHLWYLTHNRKDDITAYYIRDTNENSEQYKLASNLMKLASGSEITVKPSTGLSHALGQLGISKTFRNIFIENGTTWLGPYIEIKNIRSDIKHKHIISHIEKLSSYRKKSSPTVFDEKEYKKNRSLKNRSSSPSLK